MSSSGWFTGFLIFNILIGFLYMLVVESQKESIYNSLCEQNVTYSNKDYIDSCKIWKLEMEIENIKR